VGWGAERGRNLFGRTIFSYSERELG